MCGIHVCMLSSLQIHITLNKNTVPGDRNAFAPGGVRIGTPALTTRGFTEADFEKVAEFLHRAVQIAVEIQVCVCVEICMRLFAG